MNPAVWELDGRLLDLLHGLVGDPASGLGLELERVEAGAYVVTLSGTRRPRTHLWFLAGERSVTVEAFVMHVYAPSAGGPEDVTPVHRWLLRRNLGLRRVHFAVDDVGDVFLTGSLPLSELTDEGVDTVLGEVWQLLEEATPALLARAYGDLDALEEGLRAKVLADGAGRRPAGTPPSAPRRDARR